MLANYVSNINVSAQSMIDGNLVVYFNALIKEDKTFNITKNVQNSELYFANQDTCDADAVEFEQKVKLLATQE